ncbi:MAG: metal-dependent hydrolase [Vicinamibacterales bacterium]|nr:metal-dependent hydrolase [Vicinamibacterales bacterium]
MPSPVGHALGGIIAGLLIHPPQPAARGSAAPAALADRLRPWRTTALLGLVACLPDLDFLWARHNYETHSLGAAVAAGLLVLAWTRGRGWRLALAVAAAWSTHVLFDWLGSDDSPPIGVMALWPWSTEFYFADAWLFDAISRRPWRDDFISQNVIAILKEVALLAPPAAALAWGRRHR